MAPTTPGRTVSPRTRYACPPTPPGNRLGPDQGKPVARRGRKATGLARLCQSAGSPGGQHGVLEWHALGAGRRCPEEDSPEPSPPHDRSDDRGRTRQPVGCRTGRRHRVRREGRRLTDRHHLPWRRRARCAVSGDVAISVTRSIPDNDPVMWVTTKCYDDRALASAPPGRTCRSSGEPRTASPGTPARIRSAARGARPTPRCAPGRAVS